MKPHSIKKGVAGLQVKFDCSNCGVRLTSSLMEAGTTDYCPDCGVAFVVPGEKEKAAHAAEQLKREQDRKDELSEKREKAAEQLAQKFADEASKSTRLHLDRDPLREWIFYTVSIFTLLAISFGKHLYLAIVSDGSGICLIILVIFLIGLSANYRAVKSLRSEFVTAAFLLKKLQSASGYSEIIRATPVGVLHEHIQNLVKIARHDPNVSQDSLITLLYSRMMARSKIVDVLSGVLVSLGLIGTIVGLISMTDGLSLTLNSLSDTEDAGAMLTGMRETMQGLGTAFYTTLVGAIFGSVVLRIVNNVYTSNVDHFVSYIASLTEVRITPRLRRQSRDSNAEVYVGEVVK